MIGGQGDVAQFLAAGACHVALLNNGTVQLCAVLLPGQPGLLHQRAVLGVGQRPPQAYPLPLLLPELLDPDGYVIGGNEDPFPLGGLLDEPFPHQQIEDAPALIGGNLHCIALLEQLDVTAQLAHGDHVQLVQAHRRRRPVDRLRRQDAGHLSAEGQKQQCGT